MSRTLSALAVLLCLLSCRHEVSNPGPSREHVLLVKEVFIDSTQATPVPTTTKFSYDVAGKLVGEISETVAGADYWYYQALYERDGAGRVVLKKVTSRHLINGVPANGYPGDGFFTSESRCYYTDNVSRKLKFLVGTNSLNPGKTVDSMLYFYGTGDKLQKTFSYDYDSGGDSLTNSYVLFSFDAAGNVATVNLGGIDSANRVLFSSTFDDKKNPLFLDEDVFSDEWDRLSPHNSVSTTFSPLKSDWVSSSTQVVSYVYRTDGFPESEQTADKRSAHFFYE